MQIYFSLYKKNEKNIHFPSEMHSIAYVFYDSLEVNKVVQILPKIAKLTLD